MTTAVFREKNVYTMETTPRAAYIIANATQEWEWTSTDQLSRVGEEISYEPEEIRVDICVADDCFEQTGMVYNHWKCYRISE